MSLHGGKVAQIRTKVRHGHRPQLLSLPGEGSSKAEAEAEVEVQVEQEEVTNWSAARLEPKKGLYRGGGTPSEPTPVGRVQV